MSQAINSTGTQATTSASFNPSQIPEFLKTAGKVTKIIAGIITGIIGIGAFAIALTITPFSPEAGGAAFAASAALIGAAGFLFYSAFFDTTPSSTDTKV